MSKKQSQGKGKRRPAEVPGLPDTSAWQPRRNVKTTLSQAFLARCKHIEQVIDLRARQEQDTSIDTFDSGWTLEDVFRDELRKLLPNRYGVHTGVLSDRVGRTAGHCDVLISNDLWFPILKAGAGQTSRDLYFPVESVYAVLEVKQTLGYQTLDQAARKLVCCHRLHRPLTNRTRVTENYELDACPHGSRNPLYSAILAARLDEGVRFEDLISRFFDICKTLKRREVVRAVCVLNSGAVTWCSCTEDGTLGWAGFMEEDLGLPIVPAYHPYENYGSAMYPFIVDLMAHLYHSVLAAEDVPALYGPQGLKCSVPKQPEIRLQPDTDPWGRPELPGE